MIEVIWGTTKDKPESSRALAKALSDLRDASGHLYIGYPVIASPSGPVRLDALLVSKQFGIVAFDLVEATDLGEYKQRQDDVATMLEVKLKPYSELKRGRELKFPIDVVTFAPVKTNPPPPETPYFIANSASLEAAIRAFRWTQDDRTFESLVAAVQVVTSIRAGKAKRELSRPDSRGARLKGVEDSIANLDQHQSQAVIETVDGVQRIRGLAGSGKTIVLALKVAYLHSQHEDWRIAVTFNTRSLKEQFRRFINSFTIEQTGSEPNWDNIDILNAWGGPGTKERDGIYHKYCRTHDLPFSDFTDAKRRFGDGKEFSGVCGEAASATSPVIPLYDLILVDEAQDLPSEFLRLCYRFLKEPKRLVYAYDELQSLTSNAVLPPEELFGKDDSGKPLVRFEEGALPRKDIILEKCYRNSRPLLATAHALGFGIYREGGLVQFFEQDSLWGDVGYVVTSGQLKGDSHVTLARTADTSPPFLENHSPLDDLIRFISFDTPAQQAAWIVDSIHEDIRSQDLRPEDIVVINPNPLTTQKQVGPIRESLYERGINSELAGVSTSADVFLTTDSVTFTGIFRAKGNEAGMVYVINADECFSSSSPAHLAIIRNRLFTAITRSKAWVRVLGVGKNMKGLIEEWEQLKANDYALSFTYPSADQKRQLRLINKDTPDRRKTKRSHIQYQANLVLEAARTGELDPDALINELSSIKVSRDKS